MEKKRHILSSIILTVLLVGCVVILIGVGSFFNRLFDVLLFSAPGPCEGRVPGIERDSNRFVAYQWMSDGSAIIIMNKMGGAQLGTRFDLVNVDERTVERLLSDPSTDLVDNFTLSPSGRYIAIPETIILNSDHYNNLKIFEFYDQGQTPELRLLMKINEVYSGLWSHDEKYIALAAVPDPALSHQQAIRVAQFSPTITQVITLTTAEYRGWNPLVGWSSDDPSLVTEMGRPKKLHLIDIEPGTVEVLLSESRTCFSDITLSPTEDKLALSSHEDYAIDEGESGWDIIITDIAQGTNEVVTGFIDEDERQPTWSPDGTRLAFLRAFFDETGQAQQEIMIMDLASNSMTNLTDAAELSPFFPQWSPRGDKIAFLTDDGRDYHLNVMDIEVKKLVVLYSTGDH